MTISPDTDAIYEEAIALQPRIEEFERRRQDFTRLQRDVALGLLQNGFMLAADPKIRIEAVRLRANQIMQEKHPELFELLDRESAYVAGLSARNEAVVAAGWAENFALNSQNRRASERYLAGLDDEQLRREIKERGEVED